MCYGSARKEQGTRLALQGHGQTLPIGAFLRLQHGRTLAVATSFSSLSSLESCSRTVLGSPHDKQLPGHHVMWGERLFSAVNLGIDCFTDL